MSTTRGRKAKIAAIQVLSAEVAAAAPVYRRVQLRIHGGVRDGVARHDCGSGIDLLCLISLLKFVRSPANN